MKLYGISGLGADKRVFQFLKLDHALVTIDWITPTLGENIKEYSARLAQKISEKEQFGIIGVSFGGLVAVEISKILKPDLTILISSAETSNELRTIYRIFGKTKIAKRLPKQLFDPPRALANWAFGTKHQKLLGEILDDTDLDFAKWAVNELLNWNNQEKLTNPVLKIGGTNDKLIPTKETKNTKIIDQGAHFMIVDHAIEISQIINEEIESYLND